VRSNALWFIIRLNENAKFIVWCVLYIAVLDSYQSVLVFCCYIYLPKSRLELFDMAVADFGHGNVSPFH